MPEAAKSKDTRSCTCHPDEAPTPCRRKYASYVGGTRKGVIEFDDDATDDEIEEAVRDWAMNYVSWSWTDAPAEAKRAR